MRLIILSISLLFITASSAFANRGVYLDVSTGAVLQSDDDFDFELFEPELEYRAGSFYSLAVGYGLDIFHLELIYSDLGDTGFDLDEYLEYSRETTFVGLNFRWKWRWISAAAGLGKVYIDADAKDITTGNRTVTYKLDEGANDYAAFRFSVAANFPISERFNIYIDHIGLSWEQDDNDLEWTNPDSVFNQSGEENAKEVQSVSLWSVGLRYYFN